MEVWSNFYENTSITYLTRPFIQESTYRGYPSYVVRSIQNCRVPNGKLKVKQILLELNNYQSYIKARQAACEESYFLGCNVVGVNEWKKKKKEWPKLVQVTFRAPLWNQ